MNTTLNGSMTLAQREPGHTCPAHTKGDNDTSNKVRMMKSILIVIASST